MKPEMIKNNENQSLGAHAPNEIPFIESSMTKIINPLEKIVRAINYGLHVLSKIVLFLMMCLTTIDVLGRNFFNSPITGTYEVTGLGVALMVFFSIGVAQLTKEHISIDFLTSKFPSKVRAFINGLSFLSIILVLILTSWQSIEYTKRLFLGNQTTADLHIPVYIFSIVSSIGLLFFALVILLDFLKSILKVVQKNES